MAYRCVATSVAGFVQQLAVCYVARGYYFYVLGRIPDLKDPAKTDEKILAQYGIGVSKWVRARRKRSGLANVHYLRYGTFFVLIANHGEQPFFAAEARQLRDVRVSPIRFMGYSIGCRQSPQDGKFHASVRIDQDYYRDLKARFDRNALGRSVEDLCRELSDLPFEPYAPVRDQLRGLVRAVNRRRSQGGLEPVPTTALWGSRRPIRPFAQKPGQAYHGLVPAIPACSAGNPDGEGDAGRPNGRPG